MIVVFLGAPGSGKGTQSQMLEKQFSFSVVGAGDLLRNEIRKQSDIGLQIKEAMDNGQFPPDEFVIRLLKEYVDTLDNHILIDGFPRSLIQAHALDGILRDIIISLLFSQSFPLFSHLLLGENY